MGRLPVIKLGQPERPGGSSQRGSHRLSNAAECPRRWFFSHYRKLQSKTRPDYFVRGALIHLLLAYHYARKLPQKPTWLATFDLDAELAKEATGFPALIQQAREVYAAYVARGMDQNGLPYTVEFEIGATLGKLKEVFGIEGRSPVDDEIVTSRIDLMTVNTGKVWFKDYKSTLRGYGMALPKWLPVNEFSVKFQFQLQQALGIATFGTHFGGLMVQRIKAKTPYDMDEHIVTQPHGFMRQLVPVVEKCLLAERDVIEQADALDDRTVEEEYMPLGHPWACFSYGKPCEFMPLCLADSPGHRVAIELSGYDKKP